MTQRLRMTRRMSFPITEAAHRRLRRFATEAKMSEGEALSFVLENFDSVLNEDTFGHRLNLWKTMLAAQK